MTGVVVVLDHDATLLRLVTRFAEDMAMLQGHLVDALRELTRDPLRHQLDELRKQFAREDLAPLLKMPELPRRPWIPPPPPVPMHASQVRQVARLLRARAAVRQAVPSRTRRRVRTWERC